MNDESATVCANIGRTGRVRRTRAGIVGVVLTLGLLAWLIGVRAPWYERLLLLIPAGGAAVALLQVSRNTCVAMARLGVRENEDFSQTRVSEELARASRRVAATIYRDGALIAIGTGGVAALTSLVR